MRAVTHLSQCSSIGHPLAQPLRGGSGQPVQLRRTAHVSAGAPTLPGACQVVHMSTPAGWQLGLQAAQVGAVDARCANIGCLMASTTGQVLAVQPAHIHPHPYAEHVRVLVSWCGVEYHMPAEWCCCHNLCFHNRNMLRLSCRAVPGQQQPRQRLPAVPTAAAASSIGADQLLHLVSPS